MLFADMIHAEALAVMFANSHMVQAAFNAARTVSSSYTLPG